MANVKITRSPPPGTEEKPDQFAAVKVVFPSRKTRVGKIVVDSTTSISQPLAIGFSSQKRPKPSALKHEVMISQGHRIVVCETPAPVKNPYEMNAEKTLEVMKKAGIVSKSGKLTSRFK